MTVYINVQGKFGYYVMVEQYGVLQYLLQVLCNGWTMWNTSISVVYYVTAKRKSPYFFLVLPLGAMQKLNQNLKFSLSY